MPGSMPYSLEKGPYLSVIEDYVNGDRESGADRWRPRSATGTRSTSSTPSTRSLSTPGRTAPRSSAITSSGTGSATSPTAAGGWLPPPPFDTGGVTHHRVLAGVARRLRGRAAPHADPRARGEPRDPAHPGDPANATQHWPIELFWRCPIPWFEGWVTWRANGSPPKSGQVTVLLSTPSHGHPLKNTPLRTNVVPDYAEDPPSAVGSQGSWVVSQRYHRPRKTIMSLPSPQGTGTFPTVGLAYSSEGAPVTVSPAEWEGGVLNPPTPWLPHGY